MTLVSRLVGLAPAALSRVVEADILKRLYKILERCGNFSEVRAGVQGSEDAKVQTALERLDLTIRTLTTVLMKTPGALDRLIERRAQIEEVPDGVDSLPALEDPAVPFGELATRLLELAAALQPRRHVSPDEEGLVLSRIRGNLALLLGNLCEVQSRDDAPPVVRELGLCPLVDIFVDTLRKERGAAQHNVGVCVTRLAQNPRYRQRVRDLNGLESLHQIQLPKVEAQKAEAARLHRLETSEEAQRAAEAMRLRQRRERLRG